MSLRYAAVHGRADRLRGDDADLFIEDRIPALVDAGDPRK